MIEDWKSWGGVLQLWSCVLWLSLELCLQALFTWRSREIIVSEGIGRLKNITSTLEIVIFEDRVKMRACKGEDGSISAKLEELVGRRARYKVPVNPLAWSFCCYSAWPTTTIPTFSWCCEVSNLITSEWTQTLCHHHWGCTESHFIWGKAQLFCTQCPEQLCTLLLTLCSRWPFFHVSS